MISVKVSSSEKRKTAFGRILFFKPRATAPKLNEHGNTYFILYALLVHPVSSVVSPEPTFA